jgi:hypothetical protein
MKKWDRFLKNAVTTFFDKFDGRRKQLLLLLPSASSFTSPLDAISFSSDFTITLRDTPC